MSIISDFFKLVYRNFKYIMPNLFLVVTGAQIIQISTQHTHMESFDGSGTGPSAS